MNNNITIIDNGDTTIVCRSSTITGKDNSMIMPMKYNEFVPAFRDFNENYTHIQKAFANLNPEQREFILSGITPEEWEKYVVMDEDEGIPDDYDDDENQ